MIDTGVYIPSEWVTVTRPCQSPYLPQVGDVVRCEIRLLSSPSWLIWSLLQVVYCHQGHEIYCEAVLENKVYSLEDECKPWKKYNLQVSTAAIIYLVHTYLLQFSSSIIQPQEICKVKKVEFFVVPPTLCSAKLRGKINTSKNIIIMYVNVHV